MEDKNIELSIVIPLYNEEENIPELYRRLMRVILEMNVDYEIIFIDDGSKDKTLELLKNIREQNKNVKIIQFTRNFGHHVAVSAGLDFALGLIVITMDGDLQNRPEDIPKLIEKINDGYDIAYGQRIAREDSLRRKMYTKCFNYFIKKISDENAILGSVGFFRAMKIDVVKNVRKFHERNRFLTCIIDWLGFTTIAVPVKHDSRFKGKTKYNFKKLIELAAQAAFGFSSFPLRIAIWLGLIISILSFMFGMSIVIRKALYDISVTGYSSIIVSIFFLGGIQLIVMGIIGEYINRIYNESKERPLYIIKNKML